jgi:hypothetical protein
MLRVCVCDFLECGDSSPLFMRRSGSIDSGDELNRRTPKAAAERLDLRSPREAWEQERFISDEIMEVFPAHRHNHGQSIQSSCGGLQWIPRAIYFSLRLPSRTNT